jgi:hypothetical protein
MNYHRIYHKLIEFRKHNIPGVYEVHHIVPRCLSGGDDPENLVKLSPREHYLAHLLLVKMYPFEKKLLYALNMMSVGNVYQKRKMGNGSMYGRAKRKIYDEFRNRMKQTMIIRNIETMETRHLPKGNVIPEGWVRGNNLPTKSTFRYYNAETDQERMFHLGEHIPDGFNKGRRPSKRRYTRDGRVKWSDAHDYDSGEWFDKPVKSLKYINIRTGQAVYLTNVEEPPAGFVLNKMIGDRSMTCKHLLTGEYGMLTAQEYFENVYWLMAKLNQRHLFSTDIGLVRSKVEYIKKSGRSLNIQRYCEDNEDVVSEWLVNRSKLPREWIGKTWKSLGFFIVYV